MAQSTIDKNKLTLKFLTLSFLYEIKLNHGNTISFLFLLFQ